MIIRPLALAAVSLAIGFTTLSGGSPAAAVIDLSGTWTFAITGDFGFPFGEQTIHCTAPITQTGDDLEGDFDCGIATGSATATITEQALGADLEADILLDISGLPDIDAHAVGSVSPNGNHMEGDWTADGGYEGTFVADRNEASFLNGDLNCDTSVNGADALAAVLYKADIELFQHPGCPGVGLQFASTFGDVNCDDDVDETDALWLLRYEGNLAIASGNGCAEIGAFVTYTG